ncbi:unnamed protein product, partial [Agarophyton chilense]
MCSTTRFAVGLELRRTERAAADATDAADAAVVTQHMHRAIPSTLFDAVVKYEASAALLCSQLRLARSEAQLLCDQAAVVAAHCAKCPDTHTPQCVLDASQTSSPDVARFETMFLRASEHELRFAHLLHARLLHLAHHPSPDASDHEQSPLQTNHAAPLPERCGFSRRVPPDVSAVCNGVGIMKTAHGLYRTARSACSVRVRPNASFYFEAVVVDDTGVGGICIGVCGPAQSHTQILGADAASCGLHSTGQLVHNFASFRALASQRFTRGDRVGVLVRRTACDTVHVGFTVNGARVGHTQSAQLAQEPRWWAA